MPLCDANKIAREANRAWITIKCKLNDSGDFVATIKNIGLSPAVDCTPVARFGSDASENFRLTALDAKQKTVKMWDETPQSVIFPRDKLKTTIAEKSLVVDEWAKAIVNQLPLYLFVGFVYRTAGEKEPRHSSTVYQLVVTDSEGGGSGYSELPGARYAD